MRIAILLTLIAATSSVAGLTKIKEPAYAHSANVGAFASCRGEDLSVRHVSEDAAMGGHDLIDYALRNNSSSPCTLKGYPRFELLDRSGKLRRRGRAVNSQLLPGAESKEAPQLITLEPGKESRLPRLLQQRRRRPHGKAVSCLSQDQDHGSRYDPALHSAREH